MKRQLVITDDGSPSIRVEDLEENFHSSHGALQEAEHVFIRNGLDATTSDTIEVFEIGLGTGLNAFLSAQWANKHTKSIRYTAIELFPLEAKLFRSFAEVIAEKLSENRYLQAIYDAEWNTDVRINPSFILHKVNDDILRFTPEKAAYDIVFFDAFGFHAQPELWSFQVLQKMKELLRPEGMFVTYASRGQLKRDLKTLGFSLESLPGPPGKREMLRATKH